MKRFQLTLLIATLVVPAFGLAEEPVTRFRRLPVAEYRDKMAAGWLGQMIGVGWGAPTEFKFNGQIIPEKDVPKWIPERINQYNQDDIYVEMTFLRSMEQYGYDVSIRQAGIDFANSGYRLWHANRYGRENLRNGIAPPDSGHPKYNAHADDIDYQIEADYSGLIAPGMPNVGIELGEKFGRLMNYGDGLYGGQFVAGMYSEAFFQDDPKKVVKAGLACIPAESQFAEAIRDVLKWHAAEPDDWKRVWELIEAKYQDNPAYRRFSCSHGDFNIDAKINAAYIVMGLLYGEKDIEKTTVISMRCGQDSDCNPSNAAGVLCTMIGENHLPKQYTSALDRTPKFSHTEYNFDALLNVCEKLARQAIVRQGGRIEKQPSGDEVFVIPIATARPSALENCWEPGPTIESRYTEAELQKIEGNVFKKQLNIELGSVFPGWSITNCGEDMAPGLRETFRGKPQVFVTHPQDRDVPCTLTNTIEVPTGKKTILSTVVSHHAQGDWLLMLKVNAEQTHDRMQINDESCPDGWCTAQFDLSDWAGQTVKLELLNRATDWRFEAGYWAEIAIKSE
ncbi:ADP-ribosylglycohydrolase [Planctomycetes bacterium CA13]|uniref:ADP-ribosylglycohydrolase n=1 Tax=Novipirellula herctigrandis TaxID=2527986 RepID=A0A5C5ZBI1_9BACT|nr:ADP-ribosylglycohydrolase [Planctomycetes bacterium CA13]